MSTIYYPSTPELELALEEDATTSLSPKEEFHVSLIEACKQYGKERSLSMWGIAKGLHLKRDHLYEIYQSSEPLERIKRSRIVELIKSLRLPDAERGDLFYKLELFRPGSEEVPFKHRKRKWQRRHVRGFIRPARIRSQFSFLVL